MREQLEGTEFCLGMDDDPAESLWVRMGRKTDAGTAVGVCCRPPDQKEVNETFFTQPKEASCSKALEIMGDFNHSNTCWRDNTPAFSEMHQ